VRQIRLISNLAGRAAFSLLLRLISVREHNPAKVPFSNAAEKLEILLGYPRRSALGVFPVSERAAKRNSRAVRKKDFIVPRLPQCVVGCLVRNLKEGSPGG
jgi:hypothetical protein